MSLELKLEYSVNPEISTITIKEVTGEYTVNNLGGWGSPNPEKNSVALVLYATYQPYDKDLINLSEKFDENIYFHNVAAANNIEAFFSIPYTKDGWHEFNVSVVAVDLQSPTEGDIHYDTNLEKIQIYKTNTFIDLEAEDWVLLTDPNSYITVNLKEILLLNLIKQRNCQLEKYFQCMRCSSCKCQTEKEEYTKLNSMIQATDYRFNSEKEFEAQRMVEILTSQFKCCK